MTALEAVLVWIGACSAACIAGLGMIWIGVKLFGRFESDSFEDAHSLQKKINALELRIKALEMHADRLNGD